MDNSIIQDVLDERRLHVESKREQRQEHYEELASKHHKASKQRFETASTMASAIPFGQPILVGHHSEKGDRAYRKRIQINLEKGRQHAETAEHYRTKLQRMDNNHAISADDPDALTKLEAQLAERQQQQERMKAVNKIIRSTANLESTARITELAKLSECSIETARKLLTPDALGRVGFADFQLSNNNANIRRLKHRIEAIQSDMERITEQGESKQTRYDELGLTVIENNIVNRIQLNFDRRLTKTAYAIVKKEAFKRTKEGLFQRQLNANGRYAVEIVIKKLKELPENLEPLPCIPPTPPEPTIDPDTPKSCGYCGCKHPPDTELTFCDRCISSAYLTSDDYHLLRLLPENRLEKKRPALSAAEQQQLVPLITQAQTKATTLRQQKAAQEKRIRIQQEYEKALRKAQTEYEGFSWLLDRNIETENCIYYSHTKTFCFGWRNSLTAEVKAQLEKALVGFPFPVEFKT